MKESLFDAIFGESNPYDFKSYIVRTGGEIPQKKYVVETKESNTTVYVSLPGFQKDDIEFSIDSNKLTICAEINEIVGKFEKYECNPYHLVIDLPYAKNSVEFKSFENGILTIKLKEINNTKETYTLD